MSGQKKRPTSRPSTGRSATSSPAEPSATTTTQPKANATNSGSTKAGATKSGSTKAGAATATGSKKATSTRGPAGSARARLAAQQKAAARRRRRLIIIIVPLAVILVAVAALVVVRFVVVGSRSKQVAQDASVISAVTGVPAATLDQVGAGTGITPPSALTGAPALTADGKPRVLYVGAEYCPYCAAERWSMVVALSRFGSFSGLGQTTSSASDIFPSTPTLSFHGSTFSSQTVSFTGVEQTGNTMVNGDYAPLDTLSPADQQIFTTYNQPPYVKDAGSIPFVDIGGKYVISGSTYSPQVLQGKTHQEIATALSDPNSSIAKSVDGAANVITAAICKTTDEQPSAVCSSSGVKAAGAQLP